VLDICLLSTPNLPSLCSVSSRLTFALTPLTSLAFDLVNSGRLEGGVGGRKKICYVLLASGSDGSSR
jgi:hypothetical protein